ncbi:MAG: cob(I)yrinic acid a,c-diamide adenosyltransferase [Candidatus Paceibacterota bacterium]|jgi:cob(I)alamin adenosyltransferase
MLYTRKGDAGTTGTFGCDQRISKSSAIAEALGALDEINSLLGICKVKTNGLQLTASNRNAGEVVGEVQQNLFIIQAEMAGAEKTIMKEKVEAIEKIIDDMEKELPPITTFFVSGGTELASTFDFARTLARRAERRVVQVSEEGDRKVGGHTLAYLNRLSSLLYALARYANHKTGIEEEKPSYK